LFCILFINRTSRILKILAYLCNECVKNFREIASVLCSRRNYIYVYFTVVLTNAQSLRCACRRQSCSGLTSVRKCYFLLAVVICQFYALASVRVFMCADILWSTIIRFSIRYIAM